jgi:hypothetical protein
MGDSGTPGHLFYGSLELQEKARLEKAGATGGGSAAGSAVIQAGIAAGNINISDNTRKLMYILIHCFKVTSMSHFVFKIHKA